MGPGCGLCDPAQQKIIEDIYNMDLKEKMNQQTRTQWRELSFYYDQAEDKSKWLFLADKKGLLRLVDLLKEYARDPECNNLSAHEHYGPYMYLEIITALEPQITSHAISGSVSDILKLGELIEQRVLDSKPGDIFMIDKEYSNNNQAIMLFRVQEDNFDPSSVDPALSSK